MRPENHSGSPIYEDPQPELYAIILNDDPHTYEPIEGVYTNTPGKLQDWRLRYRETGRIVLLSDAEGDPNRHLKGSEPAEVEPEPEPVEWDSLIKYQRHVLERP